MRIKPARMLVLGVAFVVSGCSSDTSDASPSTQSGGSAGSGGTVTGGTGSSATGGEGANPIGGSATGGVATGGSATGGVTMGGTSAGGTPAVQPEAFELQGTWLYLGPWNDGAHTLEISNSSLVYADVAGDWSSHWSITEYDNGLDRFQLAFESKTGAYSPPEQNMSGSYVLSGAILTVQLANGPDAYAPVQSPGSCTVEGTDLIADCRLYMSQE